MPNPVYAKTMNAVDVRIGELGQPRTITQQITVRRSDGGFITIDTDIAAIQAEGHIPTIDAPYVDPTSIPSGMTWERHLVCRDITYRTAIGSRAIIFTVVWSTLWMDDLESESLAFVLPSSTEYNAKTRATNIYRTGWTTQPSNTNATGDIGGTSVSNGTQPTSVQVPQVAMRVRLTLDASVDSMLYAVTGFSTYINKINSSTFAGSPAGTLICEGVTAQKGSNGYPFYETIFEFLFDPWFHLEQVCESDEKGYPKLNGGAPAVVKWVRPARTPINFNDIFNVSGTLDQSWRGRTIEGWWA
jgi:hypothetical protein